MGSIIVSYTLTAGLGVMGVIALIALVLIFLPEYRETPHDKEE